MNLAIKGHATRGKEVIEILEMLGGKNGSVCKHDGTTRGWEDWVYIIDEEGFIDWEYPHEHYDIYTLEEFLEKFPYKVGDKVIAYTEGCLAQFTIQGIRWNHELNRVEYRICSSWCDTSLIQPYKEETTNKANKAVFDANAQCCDIMNYLIMEETIKIDIPKGYEFAGVDDDNQQVVFERIGCQYPKTYAECHKLMVQWKEYDCNPNSELILCESPIHDFCKIIVARNIYWKIAGEQMGLGKPWKPDFTNDDEERYGIYTSENKVKKEFYGGGDINTILTFPTEEMRDTFYENFKELVESCKELL